MKKNKIMYGFFFSIIMALVTTIILNAGLAIALFAKYSNGNGTYGEVSLRSYYECGSGRPPKTNGENDPGDPFVITRPRHLYNLSRLHGLGVYGEQTYFQLGKKDLGGVEHDMPMCYASDDPNAAMKPYLDMSNSNLGNNPINAIGSEALPFYGIFDGQNVEIKGLNVYADPQDAGLFGYTAHGSKVQNLFLSDVTIHARGYTNDYKHLYDETDTDFKKIQNNTWFVYNPNVGGQSSTNIGSSFNLTLSTHYCADNLTDFNYTETGSDTAPTISIGHPNPDDPNNATITSFLKGYSFKPLLSGNLITTNANDEITPNLTKLFSFFKGKREEENIEYPIQASSTGSLVVSSVDSYGQKHSKVLLTLEFDFTLSSATATSITMGVRLASDHGNNIGLIIGHCDGTITDCYVHNGTFDMNGGNNTYNKLPNGSDLGLIGRVGGTVQNILATQSDAGAKEGKNIGVLDFSNIYSDVIDENNANSFPKRNGNYISAHDELNVAGGIIFNPKSTTKYLDFLRCYQNQYITREANSVSFKGREVITKEADTSLGVFTIATDPETQDGTYSGDNLGRSTILNEAEADLKVNDKYYLYYATGEYSKTTRNGPSFTDYLKSYNKRNASPMVPGYYLPSRTETSKESFVTREARQNYILRFELNAERPNQGGFYLYDVDEQTDGGSFFANYLSYKLCDQDGLSLPKNDPKCGIMLKTKKGEVRKELDSITASFALPDLTEVVASNNTYAYCLRDSKNKEYVSNMINFEVKNKWANVTVIAAPSNPGSKTEQCAALGVYRIKNGDFVGQYEGYHRYFNRTFDDPDYAFFMPTNSNLAYFDYKYNSDSGKGQIGTYQNNVFVANTRKATVPIEGDAEYASSEGKTRLFVHTFRLPEGRYCLGSASSASQYVPKVYYVCAQGQDDGDYDFDETVFASNDKVENVDFLTTSRFDTNGTELIKLDKSITTYDPDSSNDNIKKNLISRRCYVALINSRRSLFKSEVCYISFTYASGKFIISSVNGSNDDTKNAIKFIAVDNYNHSWGNPPGTPAKELIVSLLGSESAATVNVYPTG